MWSSVKYIQNNVSVDSDDTFVQFLRRTCVDIGWLLRTSKCYVKLSLVERFVCGTYLLQGGGKNKTLETWSKCDFKRQKDSSQPLEYLWSNILSAMSGGRNAMAHITLTSLLHFFFQNQTLVLWGLFCSFCVLASWFSLPTKSSFPFF